MVFHKCSLIFPIKGSQGILYRYLQGSSNCAILWELALGISPVGQLEQSQEYQARSIWEILKPKDQGKLNGVPWVLH